MSVGLRSLREEDAEDVFRGWQDEAVKNALLLTQEEQPKSLEDAKAFVFFAQGKGSSGRDFAIILDDCFVGCMILRYGQGVFQGTDEIGYWILPEQRGKGLSVLAIECAKDFLIKKRNSRRIQALVQSDNQLSKKALCSAGFFCEAHFKSFIIIEEKARDCDLYCFLPEKE